MLSTPLIPQRRHRQDCYATAGTARANKVAAWPEKGFFDAPEQILLEERDGDDRDDFLQNGFFSMDNQRTPES